MSQVNLTAGTIGKGTFWSLINQFVSQFLVLAVFLVTARFVSKEAFGVMAVSLLVVDAFRHIAIESVGITLTSRKEISASSYNAGFLIVLSCGIVASALIFLLAPVIAAIIGQPELEEGLRWISIVMLTIGLSRIHEVWLTKHFQFKTLALRSILSIGIGGGIGIVMAVQGYGLLSLIAQQVITALISTLTLWLASSWRPKMQTKWEDVRSILKHSRHVSMTAAASFVGMQGDIFFASYYLGAAQTGVYNAAKRISFALFMMFSIALNNVVLPVQAAFQGDRDGSITTFKKCVFLTSLCTAPLYIGVAVLSEDIILLLLGEKWHDVAPVLSALAVAGFVSTINQYNMNIFLVHDRPHWQTVLAIVAAIGNFLVFIAMARFGVTILAWAYALKIILFYPMFLIPALRLLQMPLGAYVRQVIRPLFAAFMMACGVHVIADHIPLWPSYIRLAALVPCGVIVYVGIMLVIDRSSVLEMFKIIRNLLRKGS